MRAAHVNRGSQSAVARRTDSGRACWRPWSGPSRFVRKYSECLHGWHSGKARSEQATRGVRTPWRGHDAGGRGSYRGAKPEGTLTDGRLTAPKLVAFDQWLCERCDNAMWLSKEYFATAAHRIRNHRCPEFPAQEGVRREPKQRRRTSSPGVLAVQTRRDPDGQRAAPRQRVSPVVGQAVRRRTLTR